jgi:phosphate transport system substrate-binding protein
MRKIAVYGVIGMVLISLTFSAVYQMPEAAAAAPTPTITPTPALKPDAAAIAKDFPRIDGSTSNKPLLVTLACELYKVPCDWEVKPYIDADEKRIIPDPKFTKAPELVAKIDGIKVATTHQAYLNLINSQTDFILVATVPSNDEMKAAQEKGVTLDVRAVALDAFVFLVKADNPVNEITLDDIRAIYTGKLTDWVKLGGPQAVIKPYQREDNSGSQELMKSMVMKGTPTINAPDMIVMGMMGLINVVGRDPQGIGYSVYYYAMFILPDEKVKLLGVDGVKPTAATIGDRSYPLTSEVYAVIRQDMPADSTAVMLRDWLFTPEGQATIAKSGYVPLFK